MNKSPVSVSRRRVPGGASLGCVSLLGSVVAIETSRGQGQRVKESSQDHGCRADGRRATLRRLGGLRVLRGVGGERRGGGEDP